MKPTIDQVEVQRRLPTAKAIRVHARGSKGFRFAIETSDYRISGNHPRMADAWSDAWERVVGAARCENCEVSTCMKINPLP